MEIKRVIMSRIGVVYLITAVVAIGILAKVLYIQTVEGEKWRQEAGKLTQRPQVIKANRGNILDLEGRALASSLPRFTVAMDPSSKGMQDSTFRKNLPALAEGLAKMWPEKTPAEYDQMIRKARAENDQYLVIRRNAGYEEVKQVSQLPLFNLGKYKGGFLLDRVNVRVLPYGLLAKRTIGNESKDEAGAHVGLEGAFDYDLKGTDGFRFEYNIGSGKWAPLKSENELEPKDGLDVVTTIDIDLQDVAENALFESLVNLEAQHGCAILMEVATGEIRAMANLSRYPDGNYYEDKNHALLDRADPGSTFKVPAIMAALEDGHVKPSDTINTFRGTFNLNKRVIRDSHTGGFGILTVREVIEKSSNIGMARLIDRYYSDNPDHFVERLFGMGLNIPLNLEIEGVMEPVIKSTANKSWSAQTLASMAFGYEIEFVPIQILTFYNAIANNGTMVKPRLVRYLQNNSQTDKVFKTEILKTSICSKETLRNIRMMLEGVVLNGTAKNLQDSLYTIAGKTGTAVIHQGSDGYDTEEGTRSYRASFVGYFPAGKPKYSCIVVVTRPTKGTSYYGSVVAGGVFKAIADKVYATSLDLHSALTLPVDQGKSVIPDVSPGDGTDVDRVLKQLNIPFISTEPLSGMVTVAREEGRISVKPVSKDDRVLPDIIGMGLKDALPMLENLGYQVRISGYGRITAQNPPAGTPRDSVGIVELQLASL